MVKNLSQIVVPKVNGGLNTTDNSKEMPDTDLTVAKNIDLFPFDIKSINGPLSVDSGITVNSVSATKILGSVVFNELMYVVFSNGTISRLFYSSGSTFTEITTQDFDPDGMFKFQVWDDDLWFVNGTTTSISATDTILYIMNNSNVISGIAATDINNETGLDYISVHLSRIFTSRSNNLYVTKLFPTGAASDWGTGTYTGGDTAGLIKIDLNEDNGIVGLVPHFGNLTIFREDSIHYMTGTEILTSSITKKTNINFGVISPNSISKADKNIYFYGIDGVDIFTGVSVEQGDTKFDSITSINIDRKIQEEIDDITLANRRNFVGAAFKDKYYMSDISQNNIFVYDEINDGWVIWDNHHAETFLVYEDKLYCGAVDGFYQVDADTSASVNAEIRSKEYNLTTDVFKKMIHKLIFSFKALAAEHDVLIRWYINGEGSPLGTKEITVPIKELKMDSGHTMDSGLRMDANFKNFFQGKVLKREGLRTCDTVSVGVQTTGTNRFSLSSMEILYEITKKGI